MRVKLSRLTAGLAISILAACGAGGTAGQADGACPVAGVLDSAGQQTKLQSGGAGVASTVYQARIMGIAATACRTGQDGAAMVDLRLAVQLARGSASRGSEYPIDYFVAVIGPNGQVLSRETFRVDFQIPAERSGATANEELTLRIPGADKTPLDSYRVYAALQLTPEELEYNRRTGVR